MKRGRKGRRQPKITANTVLDMKELSSLEHYSQGKELRRVLESIDLHMKRSESWGIYGQSACEIKLLLEIIANIKPYHDGKCILVERGMMRNKRVILEHVFYMGTVTMLYNNMNVLEYLMFASAKRGIKAVHRQEEIFELLITLGLGPISLSPIAYLTPAERAVIALLVAAYSDSIMMVFNFPEYEFDSVLTEAIAKIAQHIRNKGKTLILGSRDCLLIEKACSHTAYLAQGQIIYQGTVTDLRWNYDKVLFIIRDKNISQIKQRLAVLLPQHTLSIVDNNLLVSDYQDTNLQLPSIYKKIVAAGLTPQQVEINPKTVQNAYGEVARRYDLQK